jgi:hypothetical protein
MTGKNYAWFIQSTIGLTKVMSRQVDIIGKNIKKCKTYPNEHDNML